MDATRKGFEGRCCVGAFRVSKVALLSGLLAATASGQNAFTEEALDRGLAYVPIMRAGMFGSGVAFVDLDQDGDPDLLTTGAADDSVGVFENDGTGHFIDRSSLSGIPATERASGVVAFDYDGDGDLDPFFTHHGHANVLVENLGGFQFADVSIAAGVPDTGQGTGPAVGDIDGDGWLDLYVPNYGTKDRLYRNLGTGSFLDVAPSLGLDDPWRGFQAVLFDSDWDGDLDLYVSNDKKDAQNTEMHNRLHRNEGDGTFTDISASSGTDVNIYSMGVGVGDFDGNGFQDLYPTNIGIEANPLLLNQGTNLFQSQESAAGVASFRTGWGAVFFDYDNDGRQDLYVCNIQTHTFSAQNRLYVDQGAWPCTDVAPALGVDDTFNSLCVAVADVDDDGDLDLLVQNWGDNLRLYINHEGETRSWVKFRVVGRWPNLFAAGADVAVRTGNRWQRKQILVGGNGFKGQNDMTLHFGLGSATSVDEVVVTWPDGRRRRLCGLGTNTTHVLRPTNLGRLCTPPVSVDR